MVAPIKGASPESEHYLEALHELSGSFISSSRTLRFPLNLLEQDVENPFSFDSMLTAFSGDVGLRREIEEWTTGVYYCLNRAGAEHPEPQPLKESRLSLKDDIEGRRKAGETFPIRAYIQTIMLKTISQHSRSVFEAAGRLPEGVSKANRVQTAAHLLRNGWTAPGSSDE